ncbi:MAG: PQQ-dependent sugar dehydrogenase, partial [Microbacterium sp.]
SVPPRATPGSAPTSALAYDGRWAPAGDATTLATGLGAPWSVAPVATGGALISERDTGSILEWDGEDLVRTVGVVPGVVSRGEAGLHGLALWTDADGGDWLYAYHGADDDNRVVRMPLGGETGSLTLGEPDPVFTGIPRQTTHNGGRIAFGPDGFLYVSTGDAQLRDAAQDEQSLGGKILRLTPEGEPAPGNPFDNAVWSLGHRNVQGIAWTSDGAMWASEFGQNTWDELNLIVAGGNYGWPIVEGEETDGRFVDPAVVWATSEASPSGIAAIGSTVFVSGLRGERLWVVDTADAQVDGDPRVGLVGQGRLRDVVAAPDGTLWILTNNTDGRGSPRAGDDILLRLPVAPQP